MMATSAASPPPSIRPRSLLETSHSFFETVTLVHGHAADSGASAGLPANADSTPSQQHQSTTHDASMTRWSCGTCRLPDFPSLDDQRIHFKSDFHRLNVKRKLAGKEPVSEKEFEALAEGHSQRDEDISSISGSDEEESNSSDDEEDHVHGKTQPLRKHNKIFLSFKDSDEIASLWKCVALRENEKLCKDQVEQNGLGGDLVTEDELLQRLKTFVSDRESDERNLWVVLLLRGGHFAGSIFDAKNGSVITHKTYHRYVVRAKAGGKQSTRDATGKAPKSGGASLRRHNEAALQREIRDVLISWEKHLEAASRIFVYAPSRNSKAFFRSDGVSLKRHDKRICHVPITTYRPTFKEAKRVFNELVSISYEKYEHKEPDTASIIRDDPLSEISASKLSEKTQPENVGDDFASCDGTSTSESSTVINAVEVNTEIKKSTPLHDAAKSGNLQSILKLLENGANPCLQDDRGRTPYMVAVDKEARNIFRRFMAQNLKMWDWHAANVPSALTEEMELAQAAKQAEKDAKRKAKAKELKKLKKEKQKDREAVLKSESSGNDSLAPESRTKGKSSSTVLDEAAKLFEEREKRALAAEKRISALSGVSAVTSGNCGSSLSDHGSRSSCSFCGTSLEKMTPFYRFSYQYCSTRCVNAHRLFLEKQ